MIAAIPAAKKLKLKKLFLLFDPPIPKIEIIDLELVYIETLQDVIDHLAGRPMLPLLQPIELLEDHMVVERDFNQIIGHEFAKRALEIAEVVNTMF